MSARRSRAELDALFEGIVALAREHAPASLRQVFYLAVSASLVEKTEKGYKCVGRNIKKARLNGCLSWGAIVDHTRNQTARRAYESLDSALAETATYYHRKMWTTQPAQCELWIEKRTLLGPLQQTALSMDVPIFPCNGFASLTFLHDASQEIARRWMERGQRTRILYIGDLDPSGLEIERQVHARLRELSGCAEAVQELRRLTVTREQADLWSLPTRPTKYGGSHAGDFEGESVEVEAVPPAQLRALTADAIGECVEDPDQWNLTLEDEDDERRALLFLSERIRNEGHEAVVGDNF